MRLNAMEVGQHFITKGLLQAQQKRWEFCAFWRSSAGHMQLCDEKVSQLSFLDNERAKLKEESLFDPFSCINLKQKPPALIISYKNRSFHSDKRVIKSTISIRTKFKNCELRKMCINRQFWSH